MISVFVENLRFSCVIGLLEFERISPQPIQIDAKFQAAEFIDYAAVCEFIKAEFDKNKFAKVEDALVFFQAEFKAKFSTLLYFYMKISKLNAVQNAVVGASIEHFY